MRDGSGDGDDGGSGSGGNCRRRRSSHGIGATRRMRGARARSLADGADRLGCAAASLGASRSVATSFFFRVGLDDREQNLANDRPPANLQTTSL